MPEASAARQRHASFSKMTAVTSTDRYWDAQRRKRNGNLQTAIDLACLNRIPRRDPFIGY
jgi:hypothetical protein